MEVKRNLIANFGGRVWTAAISFIFLPIYVRLLGVEAYGLITMFISLVAIVQVLDFGLSTTINRELARLTSHESDESDPESDLDMNVESRKNSRAQKARDLVHTLEGVYWLIGIGIATLTIFAAPWAARHWVHPGHISQETVIQALTIMGIFFAFQWPDSLYAGALMGLQQQVYLNGLRVVVTTIQYIVAMLLLTYVSRTIQTFFLWQSLVFALQTLSLRNAVWRFLPSHIAPPRFQRSVWLENWRFATGMTGISIISMLLGQLDKVVLSRTLSLETLGYYGIASQLAGSLSTITGPIMTAVFPRLTQLASQNDEERLREFYHRSCQLLATLVAPLTVLGIAFSGALLRAYLHSPETTAIVQPLFNLLLIGTACNSLVNLPFNLQLAYGWTRLSIYKNLIALVFFVPLLVFMVRQFGAIGAAIMWIGINASYIVFEIPIMHLMLLKGDASKWYQRDVLPPFAISLLVGLLARQIVSGDNPLPLVVVWSGFSCLVAITVSMLNIAWMRAILLGAHKILAGVAKR